MDNRRNYYRILHVQPDAPAAIIRSSYRTLMQTLKNHPDLGGDEWNAALINEAYNTLIDPIRREKYDCRLAEFNRMPESTRKNKPKSPGTGPFVHTGKCCPFCETPWPNNQPNDPERICNGCQSPLYLTVPKFDQSSSRREAQRLELQRSLKIYLQAGKIPPVPGALRDLSPKGLQFSCADRVDAGQIIKIEARAFSAIARVVHIAHKNAAGYPGPTVGAEFLTLRFHTLRGTFVSTQA